MNFNQITTFRAVMTSSSLSEAAQKLGRTQPAVSIALRTLEDTLGLKLFERRGRQLIPVPEAHYLLTESEDILSRLETVTRTIKSLADGHAGTLNASAMPGAIYMFSGYVSRTIGANFDGRLAISARSSAQIRELVGSQSIDFGFGDAPDAAFNTAHCNVETISGRCFCLLPARHPLSDAPEISVRDLDDQPMGTLQTSHAHFRKTVAAFEQADVTFRAFAESQTFLPLLQLARHGHCVAIVDPLTVISEQQMNSGRGAVVFKPLKEDIRYDYALLSPRHRPVSQLAQSIQRGWMQDLEQVMTDLEASPIRHFDP